ncbi:hypothetical protein O181_084483, partial [Austropuccinia psidii MF-1]|nr:hypothetical protein [Austropuccinia psidii MF-1]
RLATLTDALSHQDNAYPEKNPQKFHQVLEEAEIEESRFFSIKVEVFSDLVDQTQKAVWQATDYNKILKQLARGESVSDYFFEPQAKLLLFKDGVVIPRNHELQLDILKKHHDSPLAGHHGQEKTLKLINRDFYWSSMNQISKDYVSSCQKCSRNKKIHHKKLVLLKPLQIPSGPCTQIFISHVFSKHGLPISIVSDRGSLFVSSFWTKLCQQLKISRDLSTEFHPETDRQTGRVNQTLEQSLWIYVSYHQDYWQTCLPLAEFAYSNADHSSTKQSPFLTIYGRNPIFDSIQISQDKPPGNLSAKLQSAQHVVKEELESAIKRLKRYADRKREITTDLQPGDNLWLASKNVQTKNPPRNSQKDGWDPLKF